MVMSYTVLRIGFFLLVLGIMILWEWKRPKRQLSISRNKRWPHNLTLVAFNSFLLRLLFPTLAIGSAIIATRNNWGLFNNLSIPLSLEIILSVIILDFIIYLQHVIFHKSTILWRIHRMHHTDLDIDTTTGLRFHPIEMVLSMGIKMLAVIILGAPAIGVLIFEILLNATSLFNHANVALPESLDRYLRLIVVTPDMHRVHHSIIWEETNSNYGFNLPWWDKVCKTYKSQPQGGHQAMTIGLNQFRDLKFLQLQFLLLIPFL